MYTRKWYILRSSMLLTTKLKAGWRSGMRRWFKVPVNLMVWVRVLLLPLCWHSYTKYCFPYFEHLHMVSLTIIHSIDLKIYREDDQVEWGAGFRHQSFRWCGFESYFCLLLTFLKKVLFPFFGTPAHDVIYHYPCYWPQNIQAWWPCRLRCWFNAPVTSEARVWVPFLSFCRHSYTKYCFLYFKHLHKVSSTIIHAIEHTTNRQNGAVF